MTSWITFWQYVIWAALITYFGLAIVITIGGMSDVRKMLRRLDAAHAESEAGAPTGTGVQKAE
jgi:hypothetical protein